MTDLAKLVVKLEAETAKYQANLDKAQKQLSRFESGVDKSLKRIGKAFLAFGIGFAINKIAKATIEAEKSIAQLESALKSNGGAVGRTSQQLQEFAANLQRTTTFSDDAVIGMQAVLLSFREISGATFERANKAILDISARLGTDLTSAAKLVGRALADPEAGLSALTRTGIVFNDEQKKLIKSLVETGQRAKAQDLILKGLESRFGGAAVAARNTFGGALEGLKNAFGDLLEGKSGMGAATAGVNRLTDVLSSPETKAGFDSFIGFLAEAAGLLARVAAGTGKLLDSASRFGTFGGRAGGGIASAFAARRSITGTRGPSSRGARGLQARSLALSLQPIADEAAGVSEAAEKALSRIQQMVLATSQEAAIMGKGAEAVTRYRIAHGDLAEVFAAAGPAADAWKERLIAANVELEKRSKEIQKATELEARYMQEIEDGAAIFEATRTPLEKYGAEIERLNDLLNRGIISPDTYKRAVIQAQSAFDQMGVYADQAARNIQDAFANFLFDPFKDGLDGMLKGFLDLIRRIVAEAAAAKIFGSKASGGLGVGDIISTFIGSGLGAIFGGTSTPGKAAGGPVTAGKPYLVGEKGPELFMPAASGSIVPNGGWGGGVTLVQNIDARGADPSVVTRLPQILKEQEQQTIHNVIDGLRRKKYVI